MTRIALPAPTEAAWDAAGLRLAVIVRGGVAVVDLATAAVRTLPGPPVRSLAWSPDGEALVLAHDERDAVVLVDATGAERWRIAVGDGAIDEVAWSPDGRRVALRGDDLVVCDGDGGSLWRRRVTRRARDAGVHAWIDESRALHVVERVAFADEPVAPDEARWSPDAALLAVRWGDRCQVYAPDGATVADLAVAAPIRWGPWGEPVYRCERHTLAQHPARFADRSARTLTLAPDGRALAAEGDRHCLWVQDEHGARALLGHPRTITGMAWSSTGVLATVCRDGRVRRVDRERAEILDWADVDAAYATLAWSPDGERLALCRKDALIVLSTPAS